MNEKLTFPLDINSLLWQGCNQIHEEVLMDMEREESTIYHSERLHTAQERPLYSSITAGGVIHHEASLMAIPPGTGGM